MKTNLNQPQSRHFRPFWQILAWCICIHLRSPLPKIIKNDGFEVASEFNGKKTIKTRQSSEVVLEVLRARITQYLAGFLPLNLVQVYFHSANFTGRQKKRRPLLLRRTAFFNAFRLKSKFRFLCIPILFPFHRNQYRNLFLFTIKQYPILFLFGWQIQKNRV